MIKTQTGDSKSKYNFYSESVTKELIDPLFKNRLKEW
jgi:hypothetical protein